MNTTTFPFTLDRETLRTLIDKVGFEIALLTEDEVTVKYPSSLNLNTVKDMWRIVLC